MVKDARMEDRGWRMARLRHRSSPIVYSLSSLSANWLIASAVVLATSTAALGVGPTSGPYEQTTIHRREGTAPATQPRGATSGSQNSWDMGKVPLALGGVVALIFAMRWFGKKMV